MAVETKIRRSSDTSGGTSGTSGGLKTAKRGRSKMSLDVKGGSKCTHTHIEIYAHTYRNNTHRNAHALKTHKTHTQAHIGTQTHT